jgi:undecaprenyl-diphosphatase
MGRRLAAAAGRAAGRRARKVVGPLLPVIITPVALGAALSTGALVFFFNLADDIREQDGVWRFDHDGLNLAHSLRTPSRTALMRLTSNLARPDVMSGLGLLSILIAWRSKRYRPEGVLMAVTLSGGGAIIGAIKYRYGRERPSLIEQLAREETFSFPSGHAFIALSFYGTVASWAMKGRPLHQRIAIGALVTHFIGLVGASRVYLGVHYPSDVLAGYAAAVPWLTACLTAYGQYMKRVAGIAPAERPIPEED